MKTKMREARPAGNETKTRRRRSEWKKMDRQKLNGAVLRASEKRGWSSALVVVALSTGQKKSLARLVKKMRRDDLSQYISKTANISEREKRFLKAGAQQKILKRE